jgi:predicted Fe-S protein YdhL (DUF1289 family)
MSVTAGAVRWTCARCTVSVGRMDGGASDLPPTWTRSDEEAFCLGCSRELAGQAAQAAAPASASREVLARVKRDAVIEFEIGRVPDAPNRTIAQSCRTSLTAVTAVRKASF